MPLLTKHAASLSRMPSSGRCCRHLCSFTPNSVTPPFPLHPNFPEYRTFKNELLASSSAAARTVTRLDCMKPATALEHLLRPVPLCRPPFSHTLQEVSSQLIDEFSLLSSVSADHMVLTKGVRDGIYVALEALSAGGVDNAVVAPSDVYPVYKQIVDKTTASIVTQTFATLAGALDLPGLLGDSASSIRSNKVLLLPHPLTPLGRALTPVEVQQLVTWLAEDFRAQKERGGGGGHFLLLDCVYSLQLQADAALLAPLLALPNVAALHSLAKGWLSPSLDSEVVSPPAESSTVPTSPQAPPRSPFSSGVGFLSTPSAAWRRLVARTLSNLGSRQPSEASLHRALLTLKQQPLLPGQLSRRLAAQWTALEPRLREIDPAFTPPSTGYFATIRAGWEELWSEHGVVAVPPSVFGSGEGGATGCERSVISCLYDIKDDDKQASESGPLEAAPGPTPLYHVTTLSNFIRGYDKYSRCYSKTNIPESTFPDRFFLLHAHQLDTGLHKARGLLQRLDLKGDCLLVLHTEIESPWDTGGSGGEEEEVLLPHPKGQFIQRHWVRVTGLSLLASAPGSQLQGVSVEEAAALSLQLQHRHLQPYSALRPRSVSLMPIAKGCQAKCPFCFSKGSVSSDIRQQRTYEEGVERVLAQGRSRGALRAVITGGGEPFMLPLARLLALVRQCARHFPTVCAISNGYSLSQLSAPARINSLRALDAAGLTVLSLSRHGASEEENERIMWLRTESGLVAESWQQAMRGQSAPPLASLTRLRWVCVLQRGGVDSVEKLREYMSFVASSGANEVCFKELYVSTSAESVYHDAASNQWSAEHQVPLSLVLSFCKTHSFRKTSELPWGAPVFEGEWEGRHLRVAAYTEPSVWWERTSGVCRSWNYMASGEVLASLEDLDSQVPLGEEQ